MPPQYPTLPKTILLISTKAYFTPDRTLSYLRSLLDPSNGIIQQLSTHHASLLFGLIPDFLTLHPCASILSSQPSSPPIHLGAQDCSPEATYGAHTGSIVPAALTSLSPLLTIVELGHAERRRPPLNESNALIASKAAAACTAGLTPLVCVGETARPDLQGPLSMAVGTAMRQLEAQVVSILEAVPGEAPVIFAYEPVWAIGAADPAGVEYVGVVVGGVRGLVERGFGGRKGDVRVVYGGSAGPGLWSGKSNGDGGGLGKWVDGMFLGRFAHEVEGVKKVVDEVVATLGDR